MIIPVSFFEDPRTGRKIKVGSVLLMIADCSVGLVTDLYYEGSELCVKLLQPCGCYRIRNLDHDLEKEYLAVMGIGDEERLQSFFKTQFPSVK